ncbi:MAG: ATP-binding protein [Chloroflexi bacterium]|nr:ATP-binding protein [Chloroflexota bacterium]
MSEAARAAVIEAHCRELKMPSVRRDYPELVRQATHDGWDYEEFLVQLLEGEVLSRRDSAVARLLRQARFPDLKTFEQLDWEALQGVERPQLAQLATCEYIEHAEDVVIAGPIGTGKDAPRDRARGRGRPPPLPRRLHPRGRPRARAGRGARRNSRSPGCTSATCASRC